MSEVFVKTADTRLWTVTEGTGFPVILCNGGAGLADYLQPVSEMIQDRVQTIRFEQRGCGRSDATSPYNIATCLSDLEAIRQYYNIEEWIIGGHSFGADLALIYALEYPQHTKGIICLSGGRVHDDRQWHEIYESRQSTEGEIIPQTAYPFNREVNRQINRDWKEYIHKPLLLKKICNFLKPALFLYGSQDIRPSWAVEQVAHLLPYGQYIEINDAPHVLWISQSDQVQQELRRFLNDLLE
jgi:proline iminopeptidase